MALDRVTVFGGSGFIGRYVVQRLARTGAVVRVAVRDPEAALFLKPMGDVGQIAPIATDIRDDASVRQAVEGSDAVVNAVSLYVERGKTKFATIHEEGAQRVARAAAEAGIGAFVHMSGIGAVPDARSRYARSRAAGDALVKTALPSATLMQPSVVFGPEDGFFNTFAAMARLSPVLPLFGVRRTDHSPFYDAGYTRTQPVYVGDVADAIMAALGSEKARGQTYQLGGPADLSIAEVMEFTCQAIGRKRLFVPYPFWMAKVNAWFLEFLPNPLLTVDQVRLLQDDAVVDPKARTLADLGITPKAVEAIVPAYLRRFRKGGTGAVVNAI